MNDWFRVNGDGSMLVTLHIQPGASRSECAGRHGDALKIRLAAPPVDGKANAALIAFVAARLGIARAAVTLKSGQTSRRKILLVEGSTPEALAGLAAST